MNGRVELTWIALPPMISAEGQKRGLPLHVLGV
jgi:hypothetical protein